MQHLAAPINNKQPVVIPPDVRAVSNQQNTSDNSLIDRLHSLGEVVAKRPNAACSSLPPQARQLEIWADSVRGVPNAVLRSSLFTVRKTRETLKKRELLATLSGIEIRFKGERFNQTDLDVWEMLVHKARLQPLGNPVAFYAHDFLKDLGRNTGGKDYEQLKDEIDRLNSGSIRVTWAKEKRFFQDQLVDKFWVDEKTQQFVVVLSPHMLSLYESGFSYIDHNQRIALGSSHLAKWLHGFYATHAVPHPYKVKTLKELCGSTTKELREFRRMLKKALEKLVEVGAIKGWEISWDDLVRVDNAPSLSQLRHINKNKTAARKSKKTTFSSSENLF